MARDAGVDDPDLTTPERVLDGLLGSLHVLLHARVACLDAQIVPAGSGAEQS